MPPKVMIFPSRAELQSRLNNVEIPKIFTHLDVMDHLFPYILAHAGEPILSRRTLEDIVGSALAQFLRGLTAESVEQQAAFVTQAFILKANIIKAIIGS